MSRDESVPPDVCPDGLLTEPVEAGAPTKAEPVGPGAELAGETVGSGPELARAVLDAARVNRARRTSEKPRPARRPRGYSGPGPDPRDPQPLGAILNRLVRVRGWEKPAAEAKLFGMWSTVVGPELGEHSRPVKLEGGELTVEADSTAWATQIRLLAGKLVGRIAREVGRDTVTTLKVHGPTGPSWSRGPKRIRGRGPRDTYG